MDLARGVAWIRLATAGALLLAPARTTRTWMHDAAPRPGGRLAVRSLAARDAGLALGLLTAPPGRRRPWLLAGTGADVTDVVGTLASLRRLPLGPGSAATVVVGSMAAVAQLAAARAEATGSARP